MADAQQTISDDTMLNLPSQLLTGEMTQMTDSTLGDSQDLFDSTMIGIMTSTQVNDNRTDAETQTADMMRRGATCTDSCTVKDTKTKQKDKNAPVQCYVCQHWFHPPCVGERNKDIIGTWACPSCRTTTDTLHSAITMLKNIQEENREMKNIFTDKLKSLERKIDSHCTKCEKKDNLAEKLHDMLQTKTTQHLEAISEISKLRCRITELDTKVNSQTWNNFRQNDASKNIVLGSSIVRDISENNLKNTSVICIPGGKIMDISKAVDQKATDDSYQDATLVVGGNDCDPRDKSSAVSPSDIVQDFRSLVKKVKNKARTVNVSSICPRIKSPEVTSRITAVNAGLQVMCEEEGILFTDNTPSFHLQDGTINDGYLLRDGIHLTNKATDKLAMNLKLKVRDGLRTVCISDKQQTRSSKHRLPIEKQEESEIDTTHAFWQKSLKKVQSNSQQTHRQTSYKGDIHQRSHYRETNNYDTAHCYNCYETNHTSKTCRHERPITCRECGAEGHKAKHHTY